MDESTYRPGHTRANPAFAVPAWWPGIDALDTTITVIADAPADIFDALTAETPFPSPQSSPWSYSAPSPSLPPSSPHTPTGCADTTNPAATDTSMTSGRNSTNPKDTP